MGFHPELTTLVAMVLALFHVTDVKAESSGGFRGNLVEKIGKSRYKIVHTIEVKSQVSSYVVKIPTNDR